MHDVFDRAALAITGRNPDALKLIARELASHAQRDALYIEPLLVIAHHLAEQDIAAAVEAACKATVHAPLGSPLQEQAIRTILRTVEPIAVSNREAALDALRVAVAFAPPNSPLQEEAARFEIDLRAGKVRKPSLSAQACDFVRRFGPCCGQAAPQCPRPVTSTLDHS